MKMQSGFQNLAESHVELVTCIRTAAVGKWPCNSSTQRHYGYKTILFLRIKCCSS